MTEPRLRITGTDRVDEDRVIVDFSDDTSAIYSADQLLTLRPNGGMTKEEPLDPEE